MSGQSYVTTLVLISPEIFSERNLTSSILCIAKIDYPAVFGKNQRVRAASSAHRAMECCFHTLMINTLPFVRWGMSESLRSLQRRCKSTRNSGQSRMAIDLRKVIPCKIIEFIQDLIPGHLLWQNWPRHYATLWWWSCWDGVIQGKHTQLHWYETLFEKEVCSPIP